MARRFDPSPVRQHPQIPSYKTQWLRSFANILPQLANTALSSTVEGLIGDYFGGRQQERALGASQILGEDRAAAMSQAAQQQRMHETEQAIRGREAKKEEDLIGTLSEAFGLAEQPEIASEILTKGKGFTRPWEGVSMPTPADQPAEPDIPLGFEESIAQAMGGWSPEQRKEASYAFGRTSPMQDAIKLARVKGEETRETAKFKHPMEVEKIGKRGGEARRTEGWRGQVRGKLAEQAQGAGAEKVKQEKAYLHPAVKYRAEPGYQPKTVPYEPPGPGGERRGYTPGQPIPKTSATTPGATRREQVERKLGIAGIKPAEQADLLDLNSQQLGRYQRARKTVDKRTGRPFTHEDALKFALGRR